MSRTPRTPARHLTAAERAERNRQIAETHLSGSTWDEVGERFRMSGRQAKRCAKEHAEAVARLGGSRARGRVPAAGEVDVEALLALMAHAHDIALRRGLALLYAADNDNAQVGAMRAVATVSTSLREVLRVWGVDFNQTGLVGIQDALARTVMVVHDLAQRHGIPEEAVDEAYRRVPLQQARLHLEREAA
jgi:hypothetical protein